jgi:hypothetical protein
MMYKYTLLLMIRFNLVLQTYTSHYTVFPIILAPMRELLQMICHELVIEREEENLQSFVFEWLRMQK